MIVRFQSIWLAMPALHREGELRPRLDRGRRDELEEERGLADDDLAASLVGQTHLVGGADPLGLPLERDRDP